jgi:DNA modification methylase
MKKLTKHDIEFLIKTLQGGKEIPPDYKYSLFPTTQKEYELVYAGKMRKEDLLANEDGVFPVPLQTEKVFNGNEYEAFKDGWKNMIVFGDNLQFLKTIYENKDPLIKDKIKGKVKLIYIDPPFATDEEFTTTDTSARAYQDKRKSSEFVEFLRRRLIIAKEILADDGSIFVHLDPKKGHYVKLVMDEVFGEGNFLNEIVWHFRTYQGQVKNYFPRKHNIIYWYRKNEHPYFNLRYDDDFEDTVDAERWKKFIVNGNEIRGSKYPKTDSRFMAYYDRWVKEHGRKPGKDDVIHRIEGYVVDDVWTDIQALDPKDKTERIGYPTQKPEQLLRRIIESTTKEDDLVFDFFGGSGATAVTAEKLSRRWVTCDLGKLAYFTMQKRILRIDESKDLENPAKKHGKKARSFCTAQLGMYDLKKALDLEWQKYQEFVSSLFEVDIKKSKIAGFEFEGKKGNFPVKIFDYQTFKNSTINEKYLKDMHAVVGKKASGRVYIIAPANFVDFLSNYYEIDGVKYYFLKIPYHVIKELHKTPFQKLRQPQSKKNVNDLEEAIGFHFIRHPEVRSELKKDKDGVKILIKSFTSQEFESDKAQDEKGMKNFETLSAVFVDKSYNGKAFEMDDAFFADELLLKKANKKEDDDEDIKAELKKIEKKGLEISFKKFELGKQVMVIYTDIYGNDFTETFTV